MKTLRTVNNLGYAADGDVLFFFSEFGNSILELSEIEKQHLIKLLIVGVRDSFGLEKGGTLTVEFKPHQVLTAEILPGRVTLMWINDVGQQIATFNELDLMELVDIDKVRDLVLSRARFEK